MAWCRQNNMTLHIGETTRYLEEKKKLQDSVTAKLHDIVSGSRHNYMTLGQQDSMTLFGKTL